MPRSFSWRAVEIIHEQVRHQPKYLPTRYFENTSSGITLTSLNPWIAIPFNVYLLYKILTDFTVSLWSRRANRDSKNERIKI